MALGCVTLGVLGTLAIRYARTFIGRATKDSIEAKVNDAQGTKRSGQ